MNSIIPLLGGDKGVGLLKNIHFSDLQYFTLIIIRLTLNMFNHPL